MSEQKNKIAVIELRNLKKRFGVGDAEHYALNGVDLKIEKGEFVAIMGPSGCGKTTLLNILGLLERATEGDYRLDGKSVAQIGSIKQAKLRSEKIGIIFQNFNLVPRLSVVENVALPLTYRGLSKSKRLTRASEVLKNFHLQEREYYMPWQLSGGQTQRVAIARALVTEPSLILADEPTGNLDSKSSHIIMQELSELHKRGNTIIMVTHNPNLTSYASRVIHMVDGKIETDTNEHEAPVPYSANKRPLSLTTEMEHEAETSSDDNPEFFEANESDTVNINDEPKKKPKLPFKKRLSKRNSKDSQSSKPAKLLEGGEDDPLRLPMSSTGSVKIKKVKLKNVRKRERK